MKPRRPEQIPPFCTGPECHARGCHPRRPRCKWRRAKHEKWITCTCGAMHYRHRKGSGACSEKGQAAMWNSLLAALAS